MPEREDPHVLEARVGEQALPRQRPPQERDRDHQRGQAEGREQRAAPSRRPSAGSSASWTRQATSSTVGSSAADSIALIGGGASLWASGSQLWTGAQPILAARPARISTNAISAVLRQPRAAAARERVPVERAQAVPPARASATYSTTIPSSATDSPSVVSTRYFQPASSALGVPLKATSSADAAVVASTISQATARLPATGTASSAAQNR